VDPIAGISEEKFAHRTGIGAVEIDRLTPIVGIAIGEVSRRERGEVIPVRPEMVVDDIEDDGDAERVRGIDKPAEIVGLPIEPGRREKIDAVIAPAKAAGEFSHRHDLNAGDAKHGKSEQLAPRGLPGALWGEGADMQLINNELLARQPAP